jgi:acyl-CoA dehydrogenase
MEFGLNDEQRMLIGSLRDFIRRELLPLEDEIEATGKLDPDKAKMIFKKSKALGFYAMNIPEEYGGGGLSAVDTCLVEEQFGHTKDILIRRAFGNVYEVLLRCNEAQRERWLLPAVEGRRTCSIAITEPNAGSDAAAIKTQAAKDGSGWRLTGGKHFISDGEFSDFFVVSAVTDPSAGSKGISLFLVDKDAPGFTLGRNQGMMGLHGTSHSEMFFDDIRLERDNLLGEEGQGMRLVLETLGRVRLTQVGARAVGKATRLLSMMSTYAQERRQFGQPIGQFQLVQEMIADSTIEVNAARLMLLRAAWELDQGRDGRDWISMVKVQAAETLCRVADRAVQVFGGMGYCSDMPVERLYRDSRIYRIFDGTSEIHRMLVARGVQKRGEVLFDLAC